MLDVYWNWLTVIYYSLLNRNTPNHNQIDTAIATCVNFKQIQRECKTSNYSPLTVSVIQWFKASALKAKGSWFDFKWRNIFPFWIFACKSNQACAAWPFTCRLYCFRAQIRWSYKVYAYFSPQFSFKFDDEQKNCHSSRGNDKNTTNFAAILRSIYNRKMLYLSDFKRRESEK